MFNYLIFSIENGLTISRFMYDHAIILNALMSFKNQDFINLLIKEQKDYNNILLKYIKLSNQNISNEYIESNIIITEHTKLLEIKTSALSRIEIDENITNECNKIIPKNLSNVTPEFEKSIQELNQLLFKLLNNSLKKYNLIKKSIDEKEVTLFFNEEYIKHLIKETESYIYTMDFFVNEIKFTPSYIYCTQYNINVLMKEDLNFIKIMLEQDNIIYNLYAKNTMNYIYEIMASLNNEINPKSIDIINKKSLETTKYFINWSSELVSSLVDENYYTTIITLLYDHILREVNYNHYLLKRLK
ncbi:MAG: DUF2935 domain-containing protein [Bacilli bacterium]|nr:DUF2935 domain-containing protein [Bacilli bacterium]